MALTNGEGMTELRQPHTLILNQTLALAGPFSLKCAVQLGLADIIHKHGHPMPLSQLARAASIPQEKEVMLHRLMRLLVNMGVFAAQEAGPGDEETAYALTTFSTLLLKDGDNASAHVLLVLGEALVKPWYYLSDWFQMEGATPFELAHNRRYLWDLTTERPELNDLFNEAMACETRLAMMAVVTENPGVFQGLKSLVDVGGGTGSSAKIIIETFPEIKCTVLDLPHVVATMPETKGIDAIGGDMFKYIPRADAIFLKNVFHNWSDEECVKVLLRCKEAIPAKEEGGKVILVDIVLNSQSNNSKLTETQLFYDMLMMAGTTGKEREEHEWRKIFNAAGFKSYKIFPMMNVNSVIEVYP